MSNSASKPHCRNPTPADQMLTAARIRSERRSPTVRVGAGNDIADALEAKAREKLPSGAATVGAGRELARGNGNESQAPALRDTLLDSDYVAADASRFRLELANRAGALELALDAADSADAGNSLEKMLMHQLAAAHNEAMRLAGRAAEHADRSTVGYCDERAFHAAEAARAANASARMMESFQKGLVTLQRLRSGGRQVVTVQHVQVNDGGQAVVAGQVGGGGHRKRRKVKGVESEDGG